MKFPMGSETASQTDGWTDRYHPDRVCDSQALEWGCFCSAAQTGGGELGRQGASGCNIKRRPGTFLSV